MSKVVTLRLTESDMSCLRSLKLKLEKDLGFSPTQSQVVRACIRSAYHLAVLEGKDNDD